MRILVVDDDEAIRDTLDVVLRSAHHEVTLARTADEGLRALQATPAPELVMLDVKMPGRDGIEALPDFLRARPDVAVVMMSGHGTMETAVEAMRGGALDFLAKPFSRDELLARIVKVQQDRKQRAEVVRLRRQLSDTSQRMVGSSTAIEGVRQVVARLAATPARVLIEGENGSGKELVARLVHELSPRAAGPFVDVNCAAIPKELLESELFGHEKGSFTGATALRKGKFEQADGGTLFLDEVGDMPLEAQAKVLRVIEEQKVQRVGSTEPIAVDVRIVAATNKDLKAAVAEGTFREDLYYRLAVIPVRVPPLRDRPADLAELAARFLKRIGDELGRPPLALTAAGLAWLQRQRWPGNVRQFKNLMERCTILLDGPSLDVPDLERLHGTAAEPGASAPGALPTTPTGSPSSAGTTATPPSGAPSWSDLVGRCRTFAEFQDLSERLFLEQQLAAHEWNVKRTAEALEMQRSHLYKKIERYGLK